MFIHMISGLSFYDIMVYFVLFSIFGYILEVVYAAAVLGKFVNRGFLNGPWCPIYGFGIIIVGIVLKPLSDSLPVLFFGSIFVTSALEYFTGFILQKFFNQKWWDYSDMPFNLNGYICLKFSLIWGIAATSVVKLVLPAVDWLIRITPHAVGLIVCLSVVGIILVDLSATLVAIAGIKRNIRLLKSVANSIRSNTDDMGGFISKETLIIKEKYEDVFRSLTLKWSQRRILNAFPNLRNNRLEETVEQLREQVKEVVDKGEKIAAERQHVLIDKYEHTIPSGEAKPFAYSLCFTKLFWIFMIGNFAGFILETLWALMVQHTLEVRVGLVWGPFIPVYGFGAVVMTLLLYKSYKHRDLYIFTAAALIGGAFEYLCSLFQELAFGTVSWEYSDTTANIGGRTNLMYALIWGVLGLLWVKDFYPFISKQIERIPKKLGSPLTILLCTFILVDILVSGAAVIRRGERNDAIPPHNPFESWLDKTFTDSYLDFVFPNMIYVE